MTLPTQKIEAEEPKVTAISSEYIDLFTKTDSAKKYNKKFDGRIEWLRHLYEVRALKPYVRGKLLDCSVGTGRFIKYFKKATEIHANDTSPVFLDFVKKTYPQVHTKQGDLRYPLDYPTDSFDTVFSMRTLFAIGPIGATVKEMHRVCRPGGRFIFDYPNVPKGRKAGDISKAELNAPDIGNSGEKWKQLRKFHESPDTILDNIPGVTYEKIPLDMFYTSIKAGAKSVSWEILKKQSWSERFTHCRRFYVRRLFNSKLNIVPDRVWLKIEELTLRHPILMPKGRKCVRYVYVCKKA